MNLNLYCSANKNQNRSRKKLGFSSYFIFCFLTEWLYMHLVKRIRSQAKNIFHSACSSSKYFQIYPPAFCLCSLHTDVILLELMPSTLEASEIELKTLISS